ncbi:MAG: SusC/RagA family TonB-linked outer membrane protein [Ferruginibacter sp.]
MKKKYAFIKFLPILLVPLCIMILPTSNVMAQGIASVAPEEQLSMTESVAAIDGNTVSLEIFMQKFRLVYNVYYSYEAVSLKEVKVVDNDIEKNRPKDPGTLLKRVLTPVGLTFEKVSNVYIIKKSAEVNKVTPPVKYNKFAAEEVTGTVNDKNGPLANVTVAEKNTAAATKTNNSGKFTIQVSSKTSTLIFSMIGYKTKEVKLAGMAEINIVLDSNVEDLSNVVVTALGITRNKKTMGYSVGEVKAEDLVKASNINLLKSLDGKVSGVNFTNLSTDPTSSVLVNIRGTTALPTLGGNGRDVSLKGQPLYVIDGIPVGTQTVTQKDNVDFGNILSQLNPEDIDNITILKGGSAGALYGKEGGNGVIMITTKSGKGGRTGLGVSYSVSNVWDKAFQFVPIQTEYGPGSRANEWAVDGTDTWGPKLDGTTTTDYWDVKTQQWATKAMYSNGQNPVEAYLEKGHTMTNNISVQGNYDKGSFRLSLSNMNNKGVMPNTKVDQKSISLNSEYRLANKVKVSVSTSYIHTYSPNKARIAGRGDDAVLNKLLYEWPTSLQPLTDMRNYWLTGFEGIRQNGAIMNDNRPDPTDQAGVGLDNPYWWAYENVHRFTRDNFFGKIQLDWELSRNFSFLVRTGMENVKEYYEQRTSWSDADHLGKFVTGNNNTSLINSDAILTYNNTFGKFSLGASVGGNYAYSNNNDLEMEAGRLSAPKLFTLYNAIPGTLRPNSQGWGTGQNYSAYGTATVGYNNQFFLDVTGRNDWGGILTEQNIHYFYPSASLSWVASETFQLPKAVELLKFRIAKADVGNGLLRRRSIDTYSFDASDWGVAKTVQLNSNLVDKDIKPMHSVTTEGGFDLGMFNNRLHVDFTYFVKEQKNQIDNIPLVQGTGYSGLLTNIGDVRNKGFEIGLGITPVKTKDFRWDLSASFTKYKAVITRLSDKFAPNGYVFADYGRNEKVRIAVGEEIGNMYEAEPVLRMKSGKYAGMPILDGSGGEFQSSGDERDRARLGNFNPDFILGVNTTIKYKQFALNLVGSLRSGGKYVSVNQKYLESDGMAYTTLGSGPDNPWWSGGRDASKGGHPWPAENSSQYDAINSNNDGQRSNSLQDASYAKGVFLNPNYTGDPTKATDDDYIVNGADPNNTFYQVPTNSYGDVIWNFTSTRTYNATNFKLREISLAYTLPNALISKYKLQNLTISLIGRNVFQWNKSGRNEDPESAFQGVGTNQGILQATLPSIRSYGFKLSATF